MKNYVEEARRIRINLNERYNYRYLKNYSINRSRNYLELRYMNGDIDRKFLDDHQKEEYDEIQREDLRILEENLKEKSGFDIGYNSSIAGVYALIGTTLLANNNIGGIVWLTWIGYFLTKAIRPLKLRKDIQLAAWIYDNKEDVNEVIRKDVESKMERGEITATTNNAPEPKYPTDLVQYSRSMYENGIDLNNIDELSNQQLRKLKRMVKRKRRNDINE